MLQRVWLLVPLWLGILQVHAAELSVEAIAGSYEVLICKDECDKDPLVKGSLVLFPLGLTQQELGQLDPSEMSRRRMTQPNGCFELQKVDSGYRGYAGIDAVGLTSGRSRKAR